MEGARRRQRRGGREGRSETTSSLPISPFDLEFHTERPLSEQLVGRYMQELSLESQGYRNSRVFGFSSCDTDSPSRLRARTLLPSLLPSSTWLTPNPSTSQVKRTIRVYLSNTSSFQTPPPPPAGESDVPGPEAGAIPSWALKIEGRLLDVSVHLYAEICVCREGVRE